MGNFLRACWVSSLPRGPNSPIATTPPPAQPSCYLHLQPVRSPYRYIDKGSYSNFPNPPLLRNPLRPSFPQHSDNKSAHRVLVCNFPAIATSPRQGLDRCHHCCPGRPQDSQWHLVPSSLMEPYSRLDHYVDSRIPSILIT